ncbi:hypothetical protein ACFYM7_30390 [Streptomyces cyaneofuscatus]|uniref:hypothetical protein n=1 Tax=Streptomyces cyaneofuscatus TaxID=66883 RepID=UPI0036D0E6D7
MSEETRSTSAPRPRSTPRNRARWAGALAVLIAAGGLVAVPPAQADDSRPSDSELLAKCDNGTKKCVFHPSGPMTEFRGERRQVGATYPNCTSLPQRSSRSWSETTESSNSVGLSMTVTVGYEGLFNSFSTSITTSFERTWRNAHTESSSTFVEVRPGEVGWLTRSPDMQKVSGTYELIFKDRFHGKRYWYVPFEAEGPVGTSSMAQRTRPMTEEEKAAWC